MSAPTRVAVGAVVEALSALKKTVLVLHGDRLSIPPVSILISCHAHNSDASDFALGVEAEQKAGRIAAREDEFHDGECLISFINNWLEQFAIY
jgi:hypothetical protein